jgi:hypothetical protein
MIIIRVRRVTTPARTPRPVGAALQSKGIDYGEEGRRWAWIWLGEKITADAITDIDAKLDILKERWTDLSRGAGGIKALGTGSDNGGEQE